MVLNCPHWVLTPRAYTYACQKKVRAKLNHLKIRARRFFSRNPSSTGTPAYPKPSAEQKPLLTELAEPRTSMWYTNTRLEIQCFQFMALKQCRARRPELEPQH